MPELPEVETTLRGIEPYLRDVRPVELTIHNPSLRWPVSEEIKQLCQSPIHQLSRRSKYILLSNQQGSALIHLGMSGSLRLSDQHSSLRKHDHLVLQLPDQQQLRYHDPRRFGSWHWIAAPATPQQHPLLQNLGPEPLGESFTVAYLTQKAASSKRNIKALIMDAKIVVGVGNIYACESLYLAGIHPKSSAQKVSKPKLRELHHHIRQTLQAAIDQGGTTLRDFVNSSGNPGYFAQSLHVYGREDQACHQCSTPIKRIKQQQRSSWYCPQCQTYIDYGSTD